MTAYLEDWLEFGRRAREEQARNPTPGMLRLRQLKAERKAAQELAAAQVMEKAFHYEQTEVKYATRRLF